MCLISDSEGLDLQPESGTVVTTLAESDTLRLVNFFFIVGHQTFPENVDRMK